MCVLSFGLFTLNRDCNDRKKGSPTDVTGRQNIARLAASRGRCAAFVEKLANPTIRKSILAIAGQAVVSGTNFLTIVILGRLCGKEELGLYSLAFSIVIFVSELQMSLISTPYMVYSPRLKGREHAEYTGSSLLQQLGLTATIVACLIPAAIALMFSEGRSTAAPVIWALAAAIGFIILREYVRRICFSALQMRMAFLFDCAVSTLQIAGLVALYRFGHLSARNAYLVIGAACGVIALAWMVRYRRVFTFRFSRAMADLAWNWTLGKWVVASGLLWSLSMNFYPWILYYFAGEAEAGVFTACYCIAAFGNMLLMGAQNFLGPKIAAIYAESGLARMRWFVVRASIAFLVPMLPFCLLLWVFGDPIVTFIYGAAFAGNGLLVCILALNLLALALAFSFSRALFALERADVDFGVNLFALVTLLTVGLWLVRLHGALGAAWGLLLANIISSIVRGFVFFRFGRSCARSGVQ